MLSAEQPLGVAITGVDRGKRHQPRSAPNPYPQVDEAIEYSELELENEMPTQKMVYWVALPGKSRPGLWLGTLLAAALTVSCTASSPPSSASEQSIASPALVATDTGLSPDEPGVAPSTPAAASTAPHDPADIQPQLNRILAPDTPVLPPLPSLAVLSPATPAALALGQWEPPTTSWKPAAPVIRPATTGLRPLPRLERFSPYTLLTAAQPPRTTLPVQPGITTRAPDPAVPPPLPPLARYQSERASLDDPTTDTHHAFLLSTSAALSLSPLPFQRVEIPDPAALGEQIRPHLPPALEPGRLPAAVPPPRPIINR